MKITEPLYPVCVIVTSLSLSVCVNTWAMSEETHGLGGDSYGGANTVEKCQAACAANMACRAIDFTNARQCYLFTKDYQTEKDDTVTHYAMTRCGVAGLISHNTRIIMLYCHNKPCSYICTCIIIISS